MISGYHFHYLCIIIDKFNINEVNKAKFLEIKEKENNKNFKEWSNLNYIKFPFIRPGLNLEERNDLIKIPRI